MAKNRSRAFESTARWMRSVATLLHHIDQSQLRIIGIAGARTGVGVTRLARSIAQAIASRGDSVLLVNVCSSGTQAAQEDAPQITSPELLALAQLEGEMRVLDSSEHVFRLPRRASGMRSLLLALPDDTTVIMDIPSVQIASEFTRPWSMEAAAACQAVYLLCLSGETRKQELANAVTICRAQKLNLTGIILNDCKLAGSSLLTDARPESDHAQSGWATHGA